MVIIPLGMCSKQVFRTSSSVTAERGFGDDSTEKSNEKLYVVLKKTNNKTKQNKQRKTREIGHTH